MMICCRYKDDLEIIPDKRHSISEENEVFTLTIADITLDDDAEYTCTATNKAGSVSTSAELFVNTAGQFNIVLDSSKVRIFFYKCVFS